jgi:hypothetical protein
MPTMSSARCAAPAAASCASAASAAWSAAMSWRRFDDAPRPPGRAVPDRRRSGGPRSRSLKERRYRHRHLARTLCRRRDHPGDTRDMHDLVAVFCRAGHPVLDRPQSHARRRRPTGLGPAAAARRRCANGSGASMAGRSSRSRPPWSRARSQVVKSAVISDGLLCWMPLPLMRTDIERGDIARSAGAGAGMAAHLPHLPPQEGLADPSAAILIDCLRRTSEAWSHEVR